MCGRCAGCGCGASRLSDDALIDTVEILRAEMNCLTRVEVHTSPDLATPATVGWRRILILLPEDWRSWTEDERRAVLAHELAHVCRGDFFTGLLAQLSLALHFYHPLAHWLAAGCGSSRSWPPTPGRPGSAAATCRISHCSPGWPSGATPRRFPGPLVPFSRPEEPSLGGSRCCGIPSVSVISGLSAGTRFATVGTLVSLGILIAGLRGPMAATSPAAQAAGGIGPGGGGQQAPAAKGSFDLAYLPAETRMFVAVQPALLLGRPEMQPIVKRLNEGLNLKKQLAIVPSEIEQLLVFWEGSPREQRR